MCPDYTGANPYQAGLISGLEGEGIDVIPVDASGPAPLFAAWRREGRPDVLHLHWVHRFIETERRAGAVISLLLAARLLLELATFRLAGVRVVWTVHNVVSHERARPELELAFRHLVARLTDVLLVHCEAARETVSQRYRIRSGGTRIDVVRHGNYDAFYPRDVDRRAAREELDLPQDAPVILYFGLIRRYKRVPTLIESFRENDAGGYLLVVGNPWNEAIEQEVETAAANAADVRTVLEYVPDEEVPHYFAAADAAVLPHDRILTSGSAILAMTFSRAVIAPERGCLPSLLESGGGMTFDPATPGALGAVLEEALRDRDRLEAMGTRNRRVADRLDWGSIAARTAGIYAELFDRSAPDV